jgi:hypothetical protein
MNRNPGNIERRRLIPSVRGENPGTGNDFQAPVIADALTFIESGKRAQKKRKGPKEKESFIDPRPSALAVAGIHDPHSDRYAPEVILRLHPSTARREPPQ